jgi:ribonucleoside-diphosphate reductase alpha chain
MWENKEYYNGLAVLPYHGGFYPQLPMEDISENTYSTMLSCLKDINLSEVVEVNDETDLKAEIACAGNACEVV